MTNATLDLLCGPATRTLHLPRGSLRPPIRAYEHPDQHCCVCSADKHYWSSHQTLYKVASPRYASSRGPRGWVAVCTAHGADPRIHAPVRTSRHLVGEDRSVTLTYALPGSGPDAVRKHVVVSHSSVRIYDDPAEADEVFARRLAEKRERPRHKRDRHTPSCTLRFDILVPQDAPTGFMSAAERFADQVSRSSTATPGGRTGHWRPENNATPTPEV